jgi:orotate phosphoribosyltransferase
VGNEKERLGLHNVTITDVYVLLDREQGGPETLREYGITMHSVTKIREVVNYLLINNIIDQVTYNTVMTYIELN